ncbi:topoisomerase IV subunit A [Novimethylophilus kurashikiensis]|uniref:DNA topoisomerase 4 subunit A n=1 Tax=Novimethylophilus kurashikiensis TaxID=1825523 RepID=A0A2R5FC50_9PROT|nr:DNA topoisomerase IV subunit A [Novimethylophilus kurashikiensis]GBG14281.1 topoisomerase IV subunit A [Novimethylophilus kurashikiensis]
MSEELTLNEGDNGNMPVTLPQPAQYASQRYLEYAMSVVTGRALPSVADGQKPVQRRILYAMHRMGLYRSPKHVKSARVVGDVIGKYHPHGDSSVYEAMVRMAQDWSLRYPIVDGQGNFGSRDGDGAAAMRYTEARLTPIAELLLSELDEGTVDWRPNYDGVNDEPCLLPARLPFVLLNGASGIAVGMATEMPSHNLREVASAASSLIRNPDTTEEDILAAIPAPDYPGGAQIISTRDEIESAYRTGRGSLRVRARWTIENLARGQWRLVVNELPPGVSTAQVMSEIEACSNPVPKEKAGKKVFTPEQTNLKAAFLSAIASDGVRDESGKEFKVRLVIEPASSRMDKDDLIRLLLAHTSLETNAAINLTVLGTGGAPRQASLFSMLSEWCAFRLQTVIRRTQHRLEAAEKRIHILEGRQAILLDIDRAIRVIRESDDPKADLMREFKLTEIQAEDILEIRLRQLARLEGIKIGEELKKLREEAKGLKHLLSNDEALRTLVATEIDEDAKKYGDDRRTIIEAAAKVTLSDAKSVSVADDPVTLVVSKHGWLRARAGHKVDTSTLTWKVGDAPLAIIDTRTSQTVVFFDTTGRAYNVAASAFPKGNGDGVPLTSLADIGNNKIAHVFVLDAKAQYLLSGTGGYGFICTGEDLVTRQKAGKAVMTLEAGEVILPPVKLSAVTEIGEAVFASSAGKMLICPLTEMKQMAKGRGVQLMALKGKDTLIASGAFEGRIEELKVSTQPAGRKKLTEFVIEADGLEVYIGHRARAGAFLPEKALATGFTAEVVSGELPVAESSAQASPIPQPTLFEFDENVQLEDGEEEDI